MEIKVLPKISAEKKIRKCILLNGPPGSGKDTAADAIKECKIWKVACLKISGPLKNMTHGLFGSSAKEIEDSNKKEDPIPVLASHGIQCSWRQAYIFFSEEVIKPTWGADFFGELGIARVQHVIEEEDPDLIVISDCGFESELKHVVKFFGPENIWLIRIARPGCSFQGDSRNYVVLPGVKTTDLVNAGSREEWIKNVITTVSLELLQRKVCM